MATILVTGGTGFIGKSIVKLLCQLGYKVRVSTRSLKQIKALYELSCEFLVGDLSDLSFARKCCSGVDAVIHLVGIIVEQGQDTFKKVHVQITKNMIQASKENGVKRFLHMSALGTRPNARSRYHQTKWTAEELVRNSELDWTIFQPSVVFGIGDDFTKRLYKMLFFQNNPLLLFPLIDGGKSKLQPIFVGNVAEAFVRAIPNPNTFHKTYPLTGPEVYSLKEILLLILDKGQIPYKIESFPFYTLSRIVMALLSFLVYPLIGLKALFEHWRGDFWAPYLLSWLLLSLLLRKSMEKRLLFNVPSAVALPLVGIVEKLIKNPPITKEMLVMLQEDSIADSSEAIKELDLQLVSFKTLLPDIIDAIVM
ncbi:nucleoside-diphosphate sugar epimerase [Methylacidiphilum kamchatkense Kam1]|uniref:NADH dehydrogenase n=1 Tax=Methylacidiphilum kamchatkense Kam1 TaxID=1202785 RepID=A0A0C1URU6_9BACT|nr:complex I NDUFA9 subunit family protein [Methylacidiphilum kamchatkense]KIE58553.1 nucleoside-diphosphate sugar epimerase [Methylacidiphilum kamchatkense Kam1]QDQ43379.1 NADH dehydrogenase [Methylacidiphilum kamchatkense Kam1]